VRQCTRIRCVHIGLVCVCTLASEGVCPRRGRKHETGAIAAETAGFTSTTVAVCCRVRCVVVLYVYTTITYIHTYMECMVYVIEVYTMRIREVSLHERPQSAHGSVG